MPPRRSTRATSSSRLFDNSSEAGGPLENVSLSRLNNDLLPGSPGLGRGMSPGPAKFSSSYGSPPTIAPARQNVARQRYNFSSALSHVVDAVEKDNKKDAHDRAMREYTRSGSTAPPDARPDATKRSTRSISRAPEPVYSPVEEESEDSEADEADEADEEEEEDGADGNDSSESVDVVQAPAENRRATPEASADADDTSAAALFDEAERVFAETEITTPNISRSVAAKTSNLLHSIFNSAKRLRPEADFESVRRAFPRLRFFQPQDGPRPAPLLEPYEASARSSSEAPESAPESSADTSADTSADSSADSSAVKTTTTTVPTAARIGSASETIRSRVPTPGPSTRTRSFVKPTAHDSPVDELASDNGAAPVSSARSLLGRRRAQQVEVISPPTPAPEPTPGAKETAGAAFDSFLPKQGVLGLVWYLGDITRVLAMAITLFVFGLVTLRVFVLTTSSPALYEGYRMDNRLHWYGSDWRSNLRQLVPFALVHPLGAISDEEFARMNGLMLSHANEVAQLKHTDRLHGAALESINHILPAVVHMELDRTGRPVISEKFWHALKDHITADRDIFTLLWDGRGTAGLSEVQWGAIKQRLQATGYMPADASSQALTTTDVESIAQATLSQSWEAWLRSNERKVREILRLHEASPVPDHNEMAGQMADRLTAKQIAKLASQVAQTGEAQAVLVPRAEFVQVLHQAMREHRDAIKEQLVQLEGQVLDVARMAADALRASSSVAEGRSSAVEQHGAVPTGWDTRPAADAVTKKELRALVDKLVRKSIGDAQLLAMSQGTLLGEWQANLVNQVNFFTDSAGAVVDPEYTSPTFLPELQAYSSMGAWAKAGASLWSGGRGSGTVAGAGGRTGGEGRRKPGQRRASVIFEQWEQDGDCWCGATAPVHGDWDGARGYAALDEAERQAAGHPATVSVKLGLQVVPRTVVLEHINAAATLDAGAMPKEVEVWAYVDDAVQREGFRAWNERVFGRRASAAVAASDENLYAGGFVKLGAYEFGGRAFDPKAKGLRGGLWGNGPAQLLAVPLDAMAREGLPAPATDHVIVRAMTNQGATDHTCFYRLRLYGDAVQA